MSATTEQLTGSIRLTHRSSLALDNLRAFVILLVLSFHSVLAYLQFLPADPFPFGSPPYLWRAFPIVDSHRWLGFDLYCAWQDVFLMSLFFLLSGLFVWPSLCRRGTANFIHGRILRLGLPFVLVVAILMPPTLYPTYAAPIRAEPIWFQHRAASRRPSPSPR
jgi:glucans biosynthesis protein C